MIDAYIVSLIIFLGVIILLVGAVMLVEARVVVKGGRKIVINDEPDKSIEAPTGTTLLSAPLSRAAASSIGASMLRFFWLPRVLFHRYLFRAKFMAIRCIQVVNSESPRNFGSAR